MKKKSERSELLVFIERSEQLVECLLVTIQSINDDDDWKKKKKKEVRCWLLFKEVRCWLGEVELWGSQMGTVLHGFQF